VGPATPFLLSRRRSWVKVCCQCGSGVSVMANGGPEDAIELLLVGMVG
jgi:hypothetical protein